ncbi:hypothetical protein [Lactobacillus crispatus]|jgi:hypothetical protein|uniref:Transposase n=1 Tax=Lactobacillus crispatus TaxID=47770 RepID=A0ABV2B7Q4_9LACO|nr:hypothetical protein [Lactobacillus crispatus]CPS14226.1 Uncharacterised protein [Chlamydia trachomatis]DAP43928.1 MAG TPA: hypothetical protein [Caudoviricetes sp.]EFQ43490.1 hypothetical protein LBKG_02143 [Lactobacillus crispatus CTV-05]KXI20530.1 hypothetical protein HMPREF3209_00422 [Lactobacillus crispatus]MBG0732057.1 hypothetical protein [Lactobacillus crispatus]
MIYVKHGHGKWVRKDLDVLNPINQIREVANYIKRRHSKIIKKLFAS